MNKLNIYKNGFGCLPKLKSDCLQKQADILVCRLHQPQKKIGG